MPLIPLKLLIPKVAGFRRFAPPADRRYKIVFRATGEYCANAGGIIRECGFGVTPEPDSTKCVFRFDAGAVN